MKCSCTYKIMAVASALFALQTTFCSAPSHKQMAPIIARLTNTPGAIPLADLYLTSYTPAEVLEGVKNTFTGLLVVEFSNTGYCEPCKRFKPIFEKAARDLRSVENKTHIVHILYIEVDGQKTDKTMFTDAQRALNVSVRAIPTTYFFASGSRCGSISGFVPRFTDIVEQYASAL